MLCRYLLFTFCILVLYSCRQYHRNRSHAAIATEQIAKGELLAKRYCGSCHQLPDPAQLDAKTWEQGVLPVMGPRLGIFSHGWNEYPSYRHDPFLDTHFYPSKPLLTDNEWQSILDYYTATSPDSLPPPAARQPMKTNLSLFRIQEPALSLSSPSTCFIHIDTSSGTRQLIVSDLMTRQLLRLNAALQVTDTIMGNGAVVHVEFEQHKLLLCDIGEINPTNGRFGKAMMLDRHATVPNRGMPEVLDVPEKLARPVQITAVDLNNDGAMDYVACEFGFLTGSLSWYRNTGNDHFERHIIKPVPGAIKLYVQDVNKDQRSDLWVLFAQGDEGISLFINKGNGKLEEQQVLQFPAVHGSTFFELVDFNKDGWQDIVYTCGDNADYSRILKPYHGIYVFFNNGANHFEQQFFLPLNGCFKALARDYDADGDLDIAAISFFADYKNSPEEGFVYFENKGNTFQPYTFLQNRMGRWLTMDAGDLDGDGRTDLVLGNFAVGPAVLRSAFNWRQGMPFLFLQNTGKQAE
jgi:hypothetical protein